MTRIEKEKLCLDKLSIESFTTSIQSLDPKQQNDLKAGGTRTCTGGAAPAGMTFCC